MLISNEDEDIKDVTDYIASIPDKLSKSFSMSLTDIILQNNKVSPTCKCCKIVKSNH